MEWSASAGICPITQSISITNFSLFFFFFFFFFFLLLLPLFLLFIHSINSYFISIQVNPKSGFSNPTPARLPNPITIFDSLVNLKLAPIQFNSNQSGSATRNQLLLNPICALFKLQRCWKQRFQTAISPLNFMIIQLTLISLERASPLLFYRIFINF